jgi:Ni,Fe-hydrogenase maturation factor
VGIKLLLLTTIPLYLLLHKHVQTVYETFARCDIYKVPEFEQVISSRDAEFKHVMVTKTGVKRIDNSLLYRYIINPLQPKANRIDVKLTQQVQKSAHLAIKEMLKELHNEGHKTVKAQKKYLVATDTLEAARENFLWYFVKAICGEHIDLTSGYLKQLHDVTERKLLGCAVRGKKREIGDLYKATRATVISVTETATQLMSESSSHDDKVTGADSSSTSKAATGSNSSDLKIARIQRELASIQDFNKVIQYCYCCTIMHM